MDSADSGGKSHSTTVIGEPRPDRRLAQDSNALQVEVVGGPMDGARSRVVKNTIDIGRGDANDLSLSLDPMVSQRHARVTKEGEHFWLEDLRSSNGTYIGDHRIQGRTLIGPGTIFVLGETSLEFTPV